VPRRSMIKVGRKRSSVAAAPVRTLDSELFDIDFIRLGGAISTARTRASRLLSATFVWPAESAGVRPARTSLSHINFSERYSALHSRCPNASHLTSICSKPCKLALWSIQWVLLGSDSMPQTRPEKVRPAEPRLQSRTQGWCRHRGLSVPRGEQLECLPETALVSPEAYGAVRN
jgi:hypothetical protein